MHLWQWMNGNSGALQSIAAIVSLLLTGVTIVVLLVTWRAIRDQAKEARALTAAAKEQIGVLKVQTMELTNQAYAASAASKATAVANELAVESNRLFQEQLLGEMRPVLVFAMTFDPERHATRDAVKNVGRGIAVDIQMCLGLPKDNTPGRYLSVRSVIGAGDEVAISLNQKLMRESGITIRYSSLDGRRFSTVIYMRDDSVKHDFAEYDSD